MPPSRNTCASSTISRATGIPPTRWAISTCARTSRTKRSRSTPRLPTTSFNDGFYPKAAALYKKILKIAPDNEQAQLYLAEISAKQGLLVDAKSLLDAVASRRRARGDRRGADEIIVRLGTIDPRRFRRPHHRRAGARAQRRGPRAAALFRALHADLSEKGRRPTPCPRCAKPCG